MRTSDRELLVTALEGWIDQYAESGGLEFWTDDQGMVAEHLASVVEATVDSMELQCELARENGAE